MKTLMTRALAVALALLISTPAYAGVPISDVHNNGKVIFVQAPDGTYVPAQADASGNTAISGSISASLAGFTPNGNVASLSVTSSTGNVALPAGAVVLVTNTGTTNIAYIKLSVGAGTAATTDMALVAGATVGLTVGSNTFINAITASSTTTLRLAGGAGLVSGYGGGGGSAGGGDATAANQVTGNSSLSTIATNTTSIATAANQTTGNSSLSTVATNTGATTTAITAVTGTKAAGTAATSALLTACVYNTSLPTLTNGQQAAAQCDSSGRPLVTVSGAGDASAANQTVVQGVIGAATAPTKMAVAGGVYNSTPLTVTNGQSAALQVDANGYQKVNVAAGNGVAQGAAIAGQTPSTIGAQTLTANPTAYTTATTNPITINEYGGVLTQPYTLNAGRVQGAITTPMTGTTSTSLLSAPGSGLYNYILGLYCKNSHATQGTLVNVQDGSGGTTMFQVAAAPAYGGDNSPLPVAWKQTTSNTALYVANATSGASTTCYAVGYKAP